MGFKPQNDLSAVDLLLRENILQLQSIISTVTSFQLSFPGLKWERKETCAPLWASAMAVGEALLPLPPFPEVCAYPLSSLPLPQPHQHSLVLSGWAFCSSSTVNIPQHLTSPVQLHFRRAAVICVLPLERQERNRDRTSCFGEKYPHQNS